MTTSTTRAATGAGVMHGFFERQEEIVKSMPAKEMPRVYFAEILGTWMLVMVAAGGGTIAGYVGGVAGPAQVVAPALMVAASIYVLGPISGAHYNPAVTLAFAIRQDFPWRHVIPFWICQLAGSMLAAFVLKALFGLAGGLGTTVPHHGVLTSMVMEIILTFLLVTIILGTASDRKIVGTNAALAVGFTIALDGLFCSANQRRLDESGSLARPSDRQLDLRQPVDLYRRAVCRCCGCLCRRIPAARSHDERCDRSRQRLNGE